ncbi:Zn-ribbon domain-containing OB-fold protein [Rhodopila sp.]|uniref:Zn-ribbon domain-containing OB-fold protein n=1 Tax=Rhodopila sp. TaxID=2480087 RepID=UPI003D0E9DA1
MANAATSPLATYIAHLKRGELGYQYSASANQAVFYPRVIAPRTGADDLEWRISQGLGTVHATTVVHPRDGEPYNVCLVDIDEGFRMMSRVEDIPPTQVRIGLRVRFRVHTPGGDEDPYPVFIPAEGTP